jgi:hypothetical protein
VVSPQGNPPFFVSFGGLLREPALPNFKPLSPPRHQWKLFWTANRLNIKVYIQGFPVQVMRAGL